MTVRVGLLGIGFMGNCHYNIHGKTKGAKVAAIADVDPKKRSGDWSGIAGNIGGAGAKTSLAGVKVYSRAEDMIADADIDVIDVTLPTYLHAKYAIMAMRAGKHVICEKPMAISSKEGAKMVAAAKKAKRSLFVAHCIRFWPQYEVARKIVRSRKHGKTISATFRRVSLHPTWSWRNWLQDPKKSGLSALDLHIHDSDFVLYCFGRPRSVTSHSAGFRKGRIDHIVTSYDYGPNQLVIADGAWEYPPGFGIEMSFIIAMETATLVCSSDMSLKLHPLRGKSREIKVPPGDGYQRELAHFIDCIAKGRKSDVVSPESALASVRLVECEVRSALGGKTVPVKL